MAPGRRNINYGSKGFLSLGVNLRHSRQLNAWLTRLPNGVEQTMFFSSNGRIYKTEELNSFDTGDPRLPVIYLDPLSARVFIQTPGKYKDDIEEVDGLRLRGLAAQFRLQPVVDQLLRMLREKLPETFAGAADMPLRAQNAIDQMNQSSH